jgi:hypothetical protein
LPDSRLGAFLIHLGISLLIFAVLAGVIRFVWYPDFFFAADGGWQGVRIVAAVDLVLGPLLTLIVFDRRKPGLRRDLAMIATFQLSCLVAGNYVVYAQRPLALVYVDGRFFSMSADAYLKSDRPLPDFRRFSGPWPKRLVVNIPDDPGAQSEIRGSAMRTQTPLRLLADLYIPYEFSALNADTEAFSPEELQEFDQESRQLPGWLAAHGGALEDYAFFPFATRYRYVFLGIRRSTGTIAGLLETPAPALRQRRVVRLSPPAEEL